MSDHPKAKFLQPTPELDAWLRDPDTTADPRDAELAALRGELDAIRAKMEEAARAVMAHGVKTIREKRELRTELARLRLPAEVVATIRDALTDDMRRFNEADGVALAALDAAYPEQSR